jgi:hypothetical protein
MTLGELALSLSYPFGLLLDDSDVETLAINAARFYLGYGSIAALDGPMTYDNPTTPLFTPLSIPYLGPSDAPGVIFAGLDYGPDTRMGDVQCPPPPPPAPAPPPGELTTQTVVTWSEWAVIKPLFMLYVERENARALEVSRQQGIEVYGRGVAEIENDVQRHETEVLPRAAFIQPMETL